MRIVCPQYPLRVAACRNCERRVVRQPGCTLLPELSPADFLVYVGECDSRCPLPDDRWSAADQPRFGGVSNADLHAATLRAIALRPESAPSGAVAPAPVQRPAATVPPSVCDDPCDGCQHYARGPNKAPTEPYVCSHEAGPLIACPAKFKAWRDGPGAVCPAGRWPKPVE